VSSVALKDRERMRQAGEQLLGSEGWRRWVRVRAANGLSGRDAEPLYNVAHAYARLLGDRADDTQLVPT
jgi:hypothetical protein